VAVAQAKTIVDEANKLPHTKHDQFGANALADDDGDISDGHLMTISKQTFLKSGHVTADVTDINIK